MQMFISTLLLIFSTISTLSCISTKTLEESSKKLTIHSFGDSHSRWKREILDLVEDPNSIGLEIHAYLGRLMNSIGRDGPSSINIDNFVTGPEDVYVFTWGEIDCRVHVNRFADKQGVYNEINRLVNNYELAIQSIAKARPNVEIWISSVLPPASGKWGFLSNPDQPLTGTLNERLLYVALMNYRLERMAARNNFKFIDFFESYVDNDGSLIFSFSDRHVHITKFTEDVKKQVAALVKSRLESINARKSEDITKEIAEEVVEEATEETAEEKTEETN